MFQRCWRMGFVWVKRGHHIMLLLKFGKTRHMILKVIYGH